MGHYDDFDEEQIQIHERNKKIIKKAGRDVVFQALIAFEILKLQNEINKLISRRDRFAAEYSKFTKEVPSIVNETPWLLRTFEETMTINEVNKLHKLKTGG